MNIDYLYKVIGMKEVELLATREHRDKLKKELEDIREHALKLQEQIEALEKTNKKGKK